MTRKTKTAIISIISFLLVCAGIFMIVSLALASAHNVPLVEEWQSWCGVVKDAVETLPETSAVINLIK